MTDATRSKSLYIALWVAQILLALAYGFFGFMKIATPPAQLAAMGMAWTVAPGFSPTFVKILGVAEVLGAIGLILPSLTRTLPKLTVAAALCIVVHQAIAIAFHLSRGEAKVLGLNVVLIALAAFILWGRSSKAVILPRA